MLLIPTRMLWKFIVGNRGFDVKLICPSTAVCVGDNGVGLACTGATAEEPHGQRSRSTAEQMSVGGQGVPDVGQ